MSLPIKFMLRLYYDKYNQLDRKGGPEVDGELFEEVIALEEEILEKHGLPPSNKNKSILWKLTEKKKLTDKHLSQTLEHLKAAATKHLFSPVQTDLEQIKEAKAQGRSAFDILPELGHPTHEYTIFLYEDILGFVSAKDVLAELSALKRLECYGELFTLKADYPRTFRKTKVYKKLKPYLKFLDSYLDPNTVPYFDYEQEEVVSSHPLDKSRVVEIWDIHNEREEDRQSDLFSVRRPEAIDFEPDYFTLTDLIEIEEIIFSEDSAVTVTGKRHGTSKTFAITLGFDFDLLNATIRDYGYPGQSVLNYFNKNRQLNLIDSPTIISLKDKTGSTLALTQHYFKVYKPLTLGPAGKPEVMREEFYIVDEVIGKAQYNEQQVDYFRHALNGTFHHIKNHYYFYLIALEAGMSESEARRKTQLEDKVRFEISKYLYLLEKHGGRAEMKAVSN